MIHFTLLRGGSADDVGLIPDFLSQSDPRSAREQIDEAYAHGGGWRRFPGFVARLSDRSLKYPGDPRLFPLAEARLRDEEVIVYDHGWVAIFQPDGSYEVARVD